MFSPHRHLASLNPRWANHTRYSFARGRWKVVPEPKKAPHSCWLSWLEGQALGLDPVQFCFGERRGGLLYKENVTIPPDIGSGWIPNTGSKRGSRNFEQWFKTQSWKLLTVGGLLSLFPVQSLLAVLRGWWKTIWNAQHTRRCYNNDESYSSDSTFYSSLF